jgi:hypothetical protein
MDLLKGGFLSFLTETRFKVTRGEVTCRGKSATMIINGPPSMDLLKGGYLALNTETRFCSQEVT